MTSVEGLTFLSGEFTGVDEISASAWSSGGVAEVEVSGEWGLSGSLLIQRQSERREDGEVFETLNVFMADRATEDVMLYSFDSAGFEPHPPARGRLVDAELVLLRRTPRGESRTTYASLPDGYRWSKQYRPDESAEWQDVVTGTLHRTAAS